MDFRLEIPIKYDAKSVSPKTVQFEAMALPPDDVTYDVKWVITGKLAQEIIRFIGKGGTDAIL